MASAITIIGIDAATQPRKIGLARGRLDGDDLVVTGVVLGSEVESVVETIASWIGSGPTLLAIDAPLGWPAPLGQGLHVHRAGQVLDGDGHDLFRRVTDRFVHTSIGNMPLDVGADRIARTAHMTLRLLGEVRARTGLAIPLAWSPALEGVFAIEVYPAATLRCHKATCTGYKGNDDLPATIGRRF
jgi:predicted RNase H-like nuclease